MKVVVDLTEVESTCLFHMLHGQKCGEQWQKSDILSTIASPAESVTKGMDSLLKVLDDVQLYVDKVVNGDEAPNREVGIAIADALNSFSNSSLSNSSASSLQSKVQNLLMVSYLSSLTQTQTMISEKLNEIL